MNDKLNNYAKQLRKNSTDAERELWYYLRNRNLNRYKFRRQHPIPPYIVDFICERKKLIMIFKQKECVLEMILRELEAQ